jgi:hypothetical protein
MGRDNVPGIRLTPGRLLLLWPGLIIQWFIYLMPRRGVQGVAASTRLARSPFMTYVFSFGAWLYIGLLIKSWWVSP